jgi:hypothetical protein
LFSVIVYFTKRAFSRFSIRVWGLTPAIRTYISKNDLSGKELAFFYTFGSDIKQAGKRTKQLLSNITVVRTLQLANPLGNKEANEISVNSYAHVSAS